MKTITSYSESLASLLIAVAAASDSFNQDKIQRIIMLKKYYPKVSKLNCRDLPHRFMMVLEMLFKKPAGPTIMLVADFITVRMDTLSFLSQIVEASQTIFVEEDSHPLD
jgi:hypothetical protein